MINFLLFIVLSFRFVQSVDLQITMQYWVTKCSLRPWLNKWLNISKWNHFGKNSYQNTKKLYLALTLSSKISQSYKAWKSSLKTSQFYIDHISILGSLRGIVRIKFKFMEIKLKFLLAHYDFETSRKKSMFRDCTIVTQSGFTFWKWTIETL